MVEINKIYNENCLETMARMPDGLVDCVVTSPPYWALRDYQTEPIVWDSLNGCVHEWGNKKITLKHKAGETNPGKEAWYKNKGGANDGGNQFCIKCGAWRGSLGLEPTFDLYIKHLCDIFDEIKRVLKKEGTIWVNIGDTYGGSGNRKGHTPETSNLNRLTIDYGGTEGNQQATKGLEKSLCQIPSRFAIEMCNRGWILRNEIIWYKPNCMPSSIKDRFTVDFEKIFFFVKSKNYHFEQQFEDSKWFNLCWSKKGNGPGTLYKKNNPRKNWGLTKHEIATGRINGKYVDPLHLKALSENGKRNKRCVWTIPTQPFPEAHFAVFPATLIEIPIKAGCPGFICITCGRARKKIIKGVGGTIGKSWYDHKADLTQGMRQKHPELNKISNTYRRIDCGYSTCDCNAGFEPGIVYDPFMGAGTTAIVAIKNNRNFIGSELSKEYCEIAERRIGRERAQFKLAI